MGAHPRRPAPAAPPGTTGTVSLDLSPPASVADLSPWLLQIAAATVSGQLDYRQAQAAVSAARAAAKLAPADGDLASVDAMTSEQLRAIVGGKP